MSIKPIAQPGHTLVEIKGGSFTLPMLRLFGTDPDALSTQLAEKLAQAPDFFRNAPLVIDLTEIVSQEAILDLGLFIELTRRLGTATIGVCGGNEAYNQVARTLGLAVLGEGRHEKKPTPEALAAAPVNAPEPATRTITQPVRSGQRIYAHGDLIVLAPVSNGAEIMADGNIHVYGSLRGRALAGVQGDTSCRIFCKDLQAELISIAGNYRISESLDESVRSKPVQIYLDNESLIIDEL